MRIQLWFSAAPVNTRGQLADNVAPFKDTSTGWASVGLKSDTSQEGHYQWREHFSFSEGVSPAVRGGVLRGQCHRDNVRNYSW